MKIGMLPIIKSWKLACFIINLSVQSFIQNNIHSNLSYVA